MAGESPGLFLLLVIMIVIVIAIVVGLTGGKR
jgi:hypothetical protein